MNTVLQVSNLVKQYGASAAKAVDGISFSAYEGEMFCLLGINGAGKSTTINIISTLLQKTSGDVTLNGYTLGKEDNLIRQSIGVVFQGNVLDGVLTAEENILSRAAFYGHSKSQAKKRMEQLAEQLSMTAFLKRRYARLSGGQRRKCDIARALLSQPKILFLDEPTTGLDPQSRIELWQAIESLRKNEKMTVILTTHYMEETENADRIAIIDNGKILCIDTPQKLKTAYSGDTLRLVAKKDCNAELERAIAGFNLRADLVADTYVVKMDNGLNAIDLLSQIKPYLNSFEMEKGNMDNVFLNVVGRKVP